MSEPDTRPAHDTPVPWPAPSADGFPVPPTLSIVGRGRAGTALAGAWRAAGIPVDGPLGRGEPTRAETVLLCVPDAEIEAAAGSVVGRGERPRFVGHVSGATPLRALGAARAAGAETFGLHPLQTFSGSTGGSLAGVGCAIAGSSRAAADLARRLAHRLGMNPFEIDDGGRAAYHAAASVASNFLVTVEATAEAVAAGAGFAPAEARALLAPLVRRTVENWVAAGPEAALTGPVARGDRETVAAQRGAVAAVEPALLPLFDALVERTEALAHRSGARTDAQAPNRSERIDAVAERDDAVPETGKPPRREAGRATVGATP